jgi:hypothetical protein
MRKAFCVLVPLRFLASLRLSTQTPCIERVESPRSERKTGGTRRIPGVVYAHYLAFLYEKWNGKILYYHY